MASIRIRGAHAHLHGVDAKSVLSRCLSFAHPKRWHNPAYRRGDWDGKIQLFSENVFPAGLAHRVARFIEDETGNGVAVVEAHEEEEIDLQYLSSHYIVDPAKEDFALREHQMDAIRAVLTNVRGIVKSPTGSGKSEMIIAGARYLWEEFGYRSLIVEPKKGIARQMRERAQLYYSDDLAVGFLAEGCRELGPVTVATAQTLAGFRSRVRKRKTIPADPLLREVVRTFEVLWYDECLDPSTLIDTPTGRRPLGELREGSAVFTPTGEVAHVRRKWTTRKRAYRYAFTGGCELVASKSHLMVEGRYTHCKVSRIKDIRSALLNRVAPVERLPFKWDEYLLGLYYGDGSCIGSQLTPRVRWSFRKDVDAWREIFVRSGFRVSESDNVRGDTTFILQDPEGMKFCRKFGILPGGKTRTVEIAPRHRYSVGVIKGLMDAEASRTDRITLSMTSRRCVEQLADAIRSFGIVVSDAELPPPENPRHGQQWRLTICGDEINRYNALFGWEIQRKHRNRLGRQWAQRHAKVSLLSAEYAGVRDLVDIELDNEDRLFVANGLITHNCHHSSADTWYEIGLASSAVRRFGFSGTPLKAQDLDDAKLEGVTGPSIFEAAVGTLIDQGYTAKPKIAMVMHEHASGPALPTHPVSVRNRVTGEEIVKEEPLPYRDAYEKGVVENEFHNRAVVRAVEWLVDRGRQTIVLCRRKAHFTVLAQMFEECGLSFCAVWGSTDNSDRKHAKGLFGAREINVVLATTIWDEGEDVPSVEALVLAEGVKVSTNSRQRIGRGMRADSEDVWVVDFVPLCHPKLISHALARARAYESEGYETTAVEAWPGLEEEPGDDLLPFERWEEVA